LDPQAHYSARATKQTSLAQGLEKFLLTATQSGPERLELGCEMVPYRWLGTAAQNHPECGKTNKNRDRDTLNTRVSAAPDSGSERFGSGLKTVLPR
jgi:hypothetical protein